MPPRPRSGPRGCRAPGRRPRRRNRSLEPGCKMRRTGSFGRTPGRPSRPEPGTHTETMTGINRKRPCCRYVHSSNLIKSFRSKDWPHLIHLHHNFHTHQQHEVIKPLAGLIELHGADPGSLEGRVVRRERDVHRVRVGHHEGNAHPLHTQTQRHAI